MSERKVLNKYYDPDFDPSKLVGTTKPKNAQQLVRMMLPMSIQCASCGEYLHAGKKYNGRKEEAIGDDYLGIKLYRLYFRCNSCLAVIIIKTDPKNSGYTVDRGATRNFEPWKQAREEEELEKDNKERAEVGDNMRVLENRSDASKREMDVLDAIEEVRELNDRAALLTNEELLALTAAQDGTIEEQEEAIMHAQAQQAFARKRMAATDVSTLPSSSTSTSSSSLPPLHSSSTSSRSSVPPSSSSSSSTIRRLPDAVDLAADLNPIVPAHSASSSSSSSSAHPSSSSSSMNDVNDASSSIAAPSSSSSSSSSAIVAGLILKKRKVDDGVSKDDRRRAKKDKKDRRDDNKHVNGANLNHIATTSSASISTSSAPLAPASIGLAGLMGCYDDDSD